MDKAIIEQHLARARAHVAQGEGHLSRQRELLFELQVQERDCSEALRLFDSFAELQTIHIADMERLERLLAAAPAPHR